MRGEDVETLIVGGGQAGLAMSRHLQALGRESLVLEKARIAEAWRSARWDSLVANGPAWHDRFPDKEFDDTPPEGFATASSCARYFEDYAAEHALPVRTGVEVVAARPRTGGGWEVETREGRVTARNLVAATGPFQTPVIPPLIPPGADIHQLHSQHYRNPATLPPGGVLVVGAGSSGAQIADELTRAGREVWLSVGPHDRPPRRYRGKDFCYWLGVLGKWTMPTPPAGREHVTIAVSGAHGGETIDFRSFAARGVRLLGRAEGWSGGRLRLADDLARNIAAGDASYLELLREADAHVAAEGLDLPPEPEAHVIGPLPRDALEPVRELDLAAAGISTVIWATGYRQDFAWLKAPGALDAGGRALHERGVGRVPGLYFLGLPWLSMRGSSFIWGVYVDAERLARHIAGTQG